MAQAKKAARPAKVAKSAPPSQRSDKGAASDGLACGDRIADNGAEQLLGIAVRLSLDIISVLHQFLGPGLKREAVGIDDGADWQRLLGDQHFWSERYGRSSSLRRSGTGQHVFGHNCGHNRDDQRSNEQRELLHIHGEIASP